MVKTRHAATLSVAFSLAAVFAVSGCAVQPAPSYGLALAYISTDEDYKDSRFQGSDDSRDDGWGLRLMLDPGQKDKIVLEAGYQRFGDTTFNGTFNGVSDRGKIETDVIDANVGYRYPVTDTFSLGGRVGAAYADVDESEVFGGVPESSSASGTHPYGGITARYRFNDRFTLGLNYDRYFDVGEKNKTGEGDIDVIGLQAEFWFGGDR